jgi:hypothetical protein
MPIHDWSRVRAGIFHDFHQEWIREIKRALNDRVLPPGYYALSEQHAAGFGADVLTLQMSDASRAENDTPHSTGDNGGGLLVAPPPIALTAETEMEFYRRKQNTVVIRTAEDDQVVAVVEVVSPGNKSSHHAIDAFANKAAELFDHDIHLLVLDLQRPGPRDPQGIHGVIWGEISDQPYEHPADRPLTLATYECALAVRAYVKPVAVGEELPEMPLFLQPGAYVLVPLEATYQSALAGVPERWRSVLRQ